MGIRRERRAIRLGRRVFAAVVAAAALVPVQSYAADALSLEEALRLAIEQNPTILDACDGAAVAESTLDIAESAFDTRLSANSRSGLGTDTQTNQVTSINLDKRFSFGTDVRLSAGTSSTQDGFYRSFAGVTISQSLLRGFGPLVTTEAVTGAEAGLATARRAADATREQVLLDVIGAYYGVLEQAALLEIAQTAEARAMQLERMAREQRSRGLATEIDVYELETRAASAQSAALEAEANLETARDDLRVLLDLELDAPVHVRDRSIPAPPKLSEKELLALAIDQRRDLIEARSAVEIARRRADIAERRLLPDLRVGVNVSQVGRGEGFDDSLGLDESVVSLVLSADLPFTRREAESQLNIAELGFTRAKRTLARLEKAASREIRHATRQLQILEKRATLQEREVAAAVKAANIARVRFERGYNTGAELLQVQESILRAQRAQVQLRVTRLLESLRLRLATGSLQSALADLLPESQDCS